VIHIRNCFEGEDVGVANPRRADGHKSIIKQVQILPSPPKEEEITIENGDTIVVTGKDYMDECGRLEAEVKELQKELLDEQSGNYWGGKQIEELRNEVKRLREGIEKHYNENHIAYREQDGTYSMVECKGLKELYKLLEDK